jgi:hypothetical protein
MTIIGVVIKDSSEKVFEGKRPKRHADLVKDMGEFYKDLYYHEMPKVVFQGFITNDRKILSREEAYILARQNGQTTVKRPSERLYSEDLW